MPIPANVNTVVVQGFWYDEATLGGVNSPITFFPVPLSGTSTPNLTDAAAFAWLKTRQFTVTPDPASGYYAIALVANDDPDLTAFGGWRVTPTGENPFTIAVPAASPTVAATSAMAATVPGLVAGQQVQAMWLTDAAVVTTFAPPAAYLTAPQTATAVTSAVVAHNADPTAHPDIRALAGSGSVADATASVKGKAVLLGGTADSPTVPWSKVTGAPTIPTVPLSLPPSGGAGGVLSGNYPNPGFAVDMATQAEADAGDAASVAAAAADAAAKVAGHAAASDPHGDRAAATSALTAHVGAADPHGDRSVAATALAGHVAASDPHGDRSAASTALSGHVSAADPHGDRAAAATDATSKVTAHSSATDPHADRAFTTSQIAALPAVARSGSASDLTTGTVPYARLAVGTAASTVAAGNDSRIVGAAQTSSLAAVATSGSASDLASGTVGYARLPVGVSASTVAAGNDPRLILGGLTQPAAKTAAYTAGSGEIVSVDTSSGSFTVTGPTSGAAFGARWVAGTAAPTVAAPAGYTINGAASLTLALPPNGTSAELVVWQVFGTDYQPVGGFKPQLALDARHARRATPTNAGVSRSGFYDPIRTIYMPAVASAAKLRAAVGKAAAGSLVNLVCIGDSKTAGYNAGQVNSWPNQLKARLAALGVPSAGTGLVPCANYGATDSQWTATTGTWTDASLYSSTSTSGASKTFVSRDAGTVVDIWYFSTSGAFTYAIDGAAAVTVTPTGSGPVKVTVTGLANTTHTVVITTTSTATVYLLGVCVRQTSGLLIHNFGLVGATALTWASVAFGQPMTVAQAIAPDVAVFEVGSNDAGNSVALATYVTQLASMYGYLPNAVRLQVVESPRGTVTTWPSFVSAVYDQVDTAGALLLDTTDRWGSAANATTLGLLGADSLHETTAGHSDIARALAAALSA